MKGDVKMTIIEILVNVINSSLFYYMFVIGSIALIVMGVLIYVGIKTKGKVLLIDSLFKKKNFDREILHGRYLIQAGYTVVIGMGLLIFLITLPYDGLMYLLVMLIFALLDLAYDIFAIRSATKKDTL